MAPGLAYSMTLSRAQCLKSCATPVTAGECGGPPPLCHVNDGCLVPLTLLRTAGFQILFAPNTSSIDSPMAETIFFNWLSVVQ